MFWIEHDLDLVTPSQHTMTSLSYEALQHSASARSVSATRCQKKPTKRGLDKNTEDKLNTCSNSSGTNLKPD